jgi:hypothetical protein
VTRAAPAAVEHGEDRPLQRRAHEGAVAGGVEIALDGQHQPERRVGSVVLRRAAGIREQAGDHPAVHVLRLPGQDLARLGVSARSETQAGCRDHRRA